MSSALVVKAALKDSMFMFPFMLNLTAKAKPSEKEKQMPFTLFVLSQMWIS